MSVPSEHAEQVSLCQWLGATYPDLPYFAVPNGGNRNVVTAKKLKAEGVKPGVPDLFFPSLRLFIEMKKQKGGALSKHQKEWIETLQQCGYQVHVCKGAKEAAKVIEEIINGL